MDVLRGEGDTDAEMESEGGEGAEASTSSCKSKYRESKRRLKYLVYENECFEGEVQKLRTKLLTLSHDKSFLLDQLMRYEAVMVSDDDLTDYSGSDEESLSLDHLPALSQKLDGLSPVPPMVHPAVKSMGMPSSSLLTTVNKSNEFTKEGIAKAAAIISAVAVAGQQKPAAVKAATKRPAKNKLSNAATVRITKAVAKARQQNHTVHVSEKPLVVSWPLHLTQQKSQQPLLVDSIAPPRLKMAPPALKSIPMEVDAIPHYPLPDIAMETRTRRSSTSSSSSSSSSGDSDDSSSESTSTNVEDTSSPVALIPTITSPTNSTGIIKPKALTSPVKRVPPLIPISSAMSFPPPLILSPTSDPGGIILKGGGGGGADRPIIGFTPLAPALSSPTASLPFSSFTKPSSSSAFHPVVSSQLVASQFVASTVADSSQPSTG